MAILRSCFPALLAVFAATPLPAQVTPTPAAITIGVVDLDQAIDRYGTAQKERDRLQKLSEQYSEEINGITKSIDELRGQLSLLKPGSPEADQRALEVQLLANQREGLATLRKKQFDRQLEEFELLVYQDMEHAIARVAKDRGVAIVLRAQRTIEFGTDKDGDATQQSKLMQYNRRTVWFASNEVDLTPYLIKYLQVFDPRKERLEAAEAAAKKVGAGQADGKTAPDKTPNSDGK